MLRPAIVLREPPSTAQLLTYADELGLEIDPPRPLDPGIRAVYVDRCLVVNSNMPPEVLADWPGHWRYLLATAIAAVEQDCGAILFRWPMEEVGRLPQAKERAALGAGPILIGGKHGSIHHMSIPEQARWVGVPESVWVRWAALHRTACESQRNHSWAQRPPHQPLPTVNG